MNKNHLIFAVTFLAGALTALAFRTAHHDPYATPEPATLSQPAESGHVHQNAAPAADEKPVNTVCAICGMDVDPKLPTARYQGKVIGFGCKKCPAEFAAHPDKYGPAALKNQVVE
jgi:YHS domain-containing protein